MNWKQRSAKLLSVFITGYGGGFSAVLPTHYLLMPGTIDLVVLFIIPLISGLAMTWPQLGKMLGEMSNGN